MILFRTTGWANLDPRADGRPFAERVVQRVRGHDPDRLGKARTLLLALEGTLGLTAARAGLAGGLRQLL